MIDLHFHVLTGIDDGPETLEDSVALARAAADAGTRTIIATSQVSSTCQNGAATIARLVNVVNARLVEEDVRVEVVTGAEIALSYIPHLDPQELGRLGIGGGPWLLVEPPFGPTTHNITAALLALHRERPLLLAHPERCAAFQSQPKLLGSLVAAGVLLSVTAGSLVGRFGGPARHTAFGLVLEGLVYNVASDAHNISSRPPGIAAELKQVGLTPIADWLTREIPEAILANTRIPPRPDRAIRLPRVGEPRWRRRLRRV